MTTITSNIRHNPDDVVWQTPTSHWCAGCWHWVVDCIHLVDPCRIPHRPAGGDSYVQSMAYDPARGRLEIRYKWKEAVQFYPVSPTLFQELVNAASILEHLEELIRTRRVHWDHVRTERKIVASLIKGFGVIVETPGRISLDPLLQMARVLEGML